jgi:hypothetical protein
MSAGYTIDHDFINDLFCVSEITLHRCYSS